MKDIEYYFLRVCPETYYRVYFKLTNETQNRVMELTPIDFLAISAVLSRNKLKFIEPNIFISSDNENISDHHE
jgi:hypothetical protein